MNHLTSKERLLNTITGKEIDHLAWSPFLAYFWDFQPEEIRKKGMISFYKEIGADPMLRGCCTLIVNDFVGTEIKETTKNGERMIVYNTPFGELSFHYVYAKESNTWFLTKHPISTKEDFQLLTKLYSTLTIHKNFTKYENLKKVVKDEALLIPIIGSEMKSSFQSLLERWVGTVELNYALYDYEVIVLELLHVMREKSKQAVNIASECDAKAFLFWEDSSTTNISPSQFEDYILPEINNWADILHEKDKLLVHHACGSLKGLLPLISTSKIDVLESISPPPTGDVTVDEARAILPDNIGVIGGIDAVVLQTYSMKDLKEYVKNIIMKTKRHRFVLANSDSCPPGVEIEKFKMISKLVKELTC
ncbi:MAG: hypothetical protein KAG94_02785 [Clostridiales bacterium]|nr:hypothetical protein [Clostridiales bacterium]